jgi:hypothetical protein
MSLIIDEMNKKALKEALGIKDLEDRVKALEDSANSSSGSNADSTPASDTP